MKFVPRDDEVAKCDQALNFNCLFEKISTACSVTGTDPIKFYTDPFISKSRFFSVFELQHKSTLKLPFAVSITTVAKRVPADLALRGSQCDIKILSRYCLYALFLMSADVCFLYTRYKHNFDQKFRL